MLEIQVMRLSFTLCSKFNIMAKTDSDFYFSNTVHNLKCGFSKGSDHTRGNGDHTKGCSQNFGFNVKCTN